MVGTIRFTLCKSDAKSFLAPAAGPRSAQVRPGLPGPLLCSSGYYCIKHTLSGRSGSLVPFWIPLMDEEEGEEQETEG